MHSLNATFRLLTASIHYWHNFDATVTIRIRSGYENRINEVFFILMRLNISSTKLKTTIFSAWYTQPKKYRFFII